jgi:putative endonuclease
MAAKAARVAVEGSGSCRDTRRIAQIHQATADKSSIEMHYVYLLQSASHPRQQYIGLTRDLRQRLKQHNEATSPHTKKFRPWLLVAYFAFADRSTAAAFEKYLKSGSGRAFVNRHVLRKR